MRCSEDGSQLLFRTEEALDDADDAGGPSLYERAATSMIFLNDLAEIGADQVAQSADGSRLVYASRFRLTSDDNDPLIPGVGSYLDVFATDANPVRARGTCCRPARRTATARSTPTSSPPRATRGASSSRPTPRS